MALPPSIPTSFVPYSGAAAQKQRFRADYAGAFSFIAYGILGVVVLLAVGAVAYGFVLDATKAKKDADLATAEKSIDPEIVKGFVQLQNRLNASVALINNHVALSGLFAAFEKTLPSAARIATMHLSVDTAGGVKLDASGVAKNFNVLAAVSSALATDNRIKDAIFSNIVVSQKDNSVSFAFSAMIDPKFVAFDPLSYADAPQSQATTTQNTETTTP